MARRKQTLKTGPDNNISLIGISCHLKSYRLSFAMDHSLGFGFRRIKDFEIPESNEDQNLWYPFLICDDKEFKNQFCLVGNHHPQGKLLPSLRQVDYFLMARNPMEKSYISNILIKIRSIPQVLAAYEIIPSKTKDIDVLMEEMELHLLLAGKAARKNQ